MAAPGNLSRTRQIPAENTESSRKRLVRNPRWHALNGLADESVSRNSSAASGNAHNGAVSVHSHLEYDSQSMNDDADIAESKESDVMPGFEDDELEAAVAVAVAVASKPIEWTPTAEEDDDISSEDEDFRYKPNLSQMTELPGAKQVDFLIGVLQSSTMEYSRLTRIPKRERTLDRAREWMMHDSSYRDVNRISNSESNRLGASKYNPNLPQFVSTWIDPFLVPITTQTFTAKIMEPGTNVPRATVVAQAHFRDIFEAIVYKVMVNAKSGFGIVGRVAKPCSSLSESHQTPYFAGAAQAAKGHFKDAIEENPKICFIDITSDSTALRTIGADSIQPIDLEICSGYSRHHRASIEDFARTRCTVGWLPVFRDVEVTVNYPARGKRPAMQGKVPWSKLTQNEDRLLSKTILDKIYAYLYKELSDIISNRVFELPHGIGKVVFMLGSFKADQPEKNRWTNAIGCQICTRASEIVLDDSNFRCRNDQGRVHEEGFELLTLSHSFLFASDPWEVFYPPDLMHTMDNALCVHFTRLCAILLCDTSKDKNKLRYNNEVLTVRVLENGLIYQDERAQEASVAAQNVDKDARVTSRVESAKATPRWDIIRKSAIDFVGKQADNYFQQTGSMLDRNYGFPGLVLALYNLDPFEDIEIQDQSRVVELAGLLYTLMLYFTDAAVGFHLNAINATLARCKELWLNLSAAAGIADIPISVHVFFHFGKMIERFGAPLLYSLYKEESHHMQVKSDVLNNTNRIVGDSGYEYLAQVLKREGRNDVYDYWTAKFPRRDAEMPHFYLEMKALPSRHEERLRRGGKQPSICQDSIAILGDLKLVSKSRNWPPLDNYYYYECSVAVLTQGGRTAIFPEKVQALSAVGTKQGIRVMACAPSRSSYNQERRAFISSLNACLDPSCFACSDVEYASSLIVNTSQQTADEFFMPLGFRRVHEGTVIASAIQLNVTEVKDGILRYVDIKSDAVPEEICMTRFRDVCHFVKIGNRFAVLERMRGRLS